MLKDLLKSWNDATARLNPGTQRVFLDALGLVAEGKTGMAYGQDYGLAGSPCLVNSVRNMSAISDSPSHEFPEIVSLFDRINREFFDLNINKHYVVSEIAAETLVRNFGELKPMPEVVVTVESFGTYVEPTDADLAQSWLETNALPAPAPEELPVSNVTAVFFNASSE